MSTVTVVAPNGEPQVVDLKHPGLAAFLAWLLPGLGHLYQGRIGKGLLFMVCILGTFAFGLYLGRGHVVYVTFDRRQDFPYPFLCQIGVGLPAMPAVVQAYARKPLFDWMRPPQMNERRDELSEWHRDLNRSFDLGVVFTMIAGLLNILAIYDAWGGPVPPETREKKSKKADAAEPEAVSTA